MNKKWEPISEPGWKEALKKELGSPGFIALWEFLRAEKSAGKKVYPNETDIFRAFEACPFDATKVVILGQDPYHGEGQATGLCFSVPDGVAVPPSLRNIFKELSEDLQCPVPKSGNLLAWAKQGVLLLNASLTVEDGRPGSHAGKGWETLTDAAIKALAAKETALVFLLWGKSAASKAGLVDTSKHCVLLASHPSPLSARNGFLGCRHFSKANDYLLKFGSAPIAWQL